MSRPWLRLVFAGSHLTKNRLNAIVFLGFRSIWGGNARTGTKRKAKKVRSLIESGKVIGKQIRTVFAGSNSDGKVIIVF